MPILTLATWWVLRPDPAVHYLTETVRRGNIEKTVKAIGDVSPLHLVDVGAQASGQVTKMYVKLGQFVKKGELIAEIDAETQQNELDTARSRLTIAQEQLRARQVALDVAQKQYNREKALWAENATGKAAFESSGETLANAKAALADTKAQIQQAQIAVKNAQNTLGYTRIIAPIDGTVVSIRVEEGQTLNAAQSTPAIVQMADLSKMLLKMQIAEGDLGKVKPGMNVSFTTLSEPDTEHHAVIESIDPGLTTLSQGSYTTNTDTSNIAVYYYARAVVDNTDGKLAIGMTTQNVIAADSAKNVLVIPSVAIAERDGKKYVRLLNDDNTVQEQAVTTGMSDNMNTEIKNGLSEGQQVILEDSSAAQPDGNTPEM
ncbi:MAG: efflux RND transporter periplasmic adaptor subunit [Neisseria sp.]|nr:efflux RND transporter periplasmic adaptor subunit [Neisseria sp.]